MIIIIQTWKYRCQSSRHFHWYLEKLVMTGVKAVVLEDVVELDKVGHVECDSGLGL